MFKIIQDRTFTHPVTIQVPVDGGYDTGTVDATYRVLDAETAESFDLRSGDGMTAFLIATLAKVDGFVDDNDQPIAWNDKFRDGCLADYWIRQGLLDGYLNAVRKAPLGN